MGFEIEQQQEPMSFSRQPAFDQLWEVWQSAQAAGWDGEEAEPVATETYQIAWRLIESLPPTCPSPTIAAEPDGHLRLEWYQDRRRLLSVSVSPEGTLYWAALVDSEDPRGSCPFLGDLPGTLQYWIGRVCR